jgi:hypothetical protein
MLKSSARCHHQEHSAAARSAPVSAAALALAAASQTDELLTSRRLRWDMLVRAASSAAVLSHVNAPALRATHRRSCRRCLCACDHHQCDDDCTTVTFLGGLTRLLFPLFPVDHDDLLKPNTVSKNIQSQFPSGPTGAGTVRCVFLRSYCTLEKFGWFFEGNGWFFQLF